MRLIDIDAFYKFCDISLKIGHEVYPEYYDDYLGSDMFTVKAIPIEWLINYEIKNGQETRLQEAITQWEKENETN